MLGVDAAHGQAIPQPGKRAQMATEANAGISAAAAAAAAGSVRQQVESIVAPAAW